MKTPISFKSLNLVCKQNTFWNVKRDIRRRENTAAVMDNTSNILILGHSFVRCLQTFLTKHHDRRTTHNMDLPHENVSFLGIGGRTASKMLSFGLDKIKAFQPKVIILELGTNDLCVVGQRPESVGSDIEHLVQVLHDHCGAEFIMVCLVIYWSAIPPHVLDFSHKVDLLNKYLKVVLETLPYAEAWSHTGLQSPSIAVLC